MSKYACEMSQWLSAATVKIVETSKERAETHITGINRAQGRKQSITYTVFLSCLRSLEENSLSTSRKARLGGG